jgi:hypothetical protein
LQKNLVRIFWLVCGRIFLQGFKGLKRLILRQKGLVAGCIGNSWPVDEQIMQILPELPAPGWL